MFSCTSMDLKLPFICDCSHRNIKLLEDGFIALTSDVVIYSFLSALLRQLSVLLSLVHVQCGAHWYQKLNGSRYSTPKCSQFPNQKRNMQAQGCSTSVVHIVWFRNVLWNILVGLYKAMSYQLKIFFSQSILKSLWYAYYIPFVNGAKMVQ